MFNNGKTKSHETIPTSSSLPLPNYTSFSASTSGYLPVNSKQKIYTTTKKKTKKTPIKNNLLSGFSNLKPGRRLWDWKFFGYIVLLIVVSVLVAYLWHLLLNSDAFGSDFNGEFYGLIWTFSSVIIAIMLSKYVMEHSDIFYIRLGRYVEMMNMIREMVISLGLGYNPTNITIAVVRSDLWDLKNLLKLLVITTEFVFTGDKIRMNKPKMLRYQDLKKYMGGEGNKALYQEIFLNYNMEVVTDDIKLDPMLISIILLKLIEFKVFTFINTQRFMVKNDPLPFFVRYQETLGEIQVDKALQTFWLHKHIILFVVGLNLFLLPMFIWHKMKVYIVVFYPMVVLTFFIVSLLIKWLGDPFEGSLYHSRFDYEHTRRYVLELITNFLDENNQIDLCKTS